MKNRIASICKATGYIIFILTFIGGIIISNQEVVTRGLYSTFTETVFNWTMALTIWFAGFLSGLLLIAISEIISLLQGIKNNTESKPVKTSATVKSEQLDESIPKI